jgi:hypothetical protein
MIIIHGLNNNLGKGQIKRPAQASGVASSFLVFLLVLCRELPLNFEMTGPMKYEDRTHFTGQALWNIKRRNHPQGRRAFVKKNDYLTSVLI